MKFNDEEDVNEEITFAPVVQELENEQELLSRMIIQQKQLKELQSRQKRLMELQEQLAKMDCKAGNSMQEKLTKLKTAKARLDQLQGLVTTIKSAETGDNDVNEQELTAERQEKNQRIKLALEELNELKSLINVLSVNQDQSSVAESITNADSSFAEEQMQDMYQSVLPEVSVVQQEDDVPRERDSNSRGDMLRKTSAKKKVSRYFDPIGSPVQYREEMNGQGQLEIDNDDKLSDQLWTEMNRHEVLLEELRERRKELETLMSEKNGDSVANDDDSVRSNAGSTSEEKNLETEDNLYETSQSRCLFGLDENDTKRLIEIIRSRKNLVAPTDKTTATWGSSSETSDSDDDEMADESMAQSVENACSTTEKDNGETQTVGAQESMSLLQEINRQKLSGVSKYAYRGEHEIDYRPPTRRRVSPNVKQVDTGLLNASAWKVMQDKLQEDLSSANKTMHILLEDQQALTKLLQNTLNLQQASTSSNLCYGISPDFLIYQLDNCSSQFSTLQKQTKTLQWQLYELTKTPPGENEQDSDCYNSVKFGLGDNKFLSGQESSANRFPIQEVIRQSQSLRPDPASKIVKDLAKKKDVSVISSSNLRALKADKSPFSDLREAAQTSVDENKKGNLFEALRDCIYSEAAILISQNEMRPHFLIELFHNLQLLNSDYLRQHCLYVLQDIIDGYISEGQKKPKKEATKADEAKKMKPASSYSENTPSESSATSEDELYTKLTASGDVCYDFSLKVSSASELSTPSNDETGINPFAAEDLGSTVIHLDAALRHMREVERMKQEYVMHARNEVHGDAQLNRDKQGKSATRKNEGSVPQVNTRLLRTRIKQILSEVIPFLKVNQDKEFDLKLMKKMQTVVVNLVAQTIESKRVMEINGSLKEESDEEDKVNMTTFFSSQINSVLLEALQKFLGQQLGTCGEELIVSLSEVLFNELAFYHIMQDLGKANAQDDIKPLISSSKSDKKEPTISLTETAPEEDEENGGEQISNANSDAGSVKNEDATDDKAVEGQSLMDSQNCLPVTVDLSVSETQPLTSYGSGEDEEEGSGDEYVYKEPDVPTSMQQDNSGKELDDDCEQHDTDCGVASERERQECENQENQTEDFHSSQTEDKE